MVGWAVAYGAAVLLGRETRVGGSEFSLAWPAAAVSTVWLLSTRGIPLRVVALAVLVTVNGLINPFSDGSVLTGLLFGGVNALHAATAVAVLAAFGWRTPRPPDQLRDIGALATAALSAALVGSVVGGALTELRLGGSFVDGMVLIGARNAVSTFVGVVTLLAIPRLHRSGGPASSVERVGLVVAASATSVGVMALPMPVLFLLVPLTVAVAMRCGPSIVSVLAGAQGLLVVFVTVRGGGQFAEIDDIQVRVLVAQVLIVVLVLVGLVLALGERDRARALRRSQAAEARLVDLALHDQLTGLPNRTLVGDRIEAGLAEARRSGLRMAILYIDLDRFKQINDTRGHDGGDRVLRLFADRLSGLARAHDTVARLGGDEFVMVCPAVADIDHARSIASRVVHRMDEPFDVDGEPLMVTASVGVTLADGRDGSVRDVLRRADAALYAAKDHGRSRYEVFDAAEQGSAAAV
nr:diguanylate cyclase [Nocardioides thalensis]